VIPITLPRDRPFFAIPAQRPPLAASIRTPAELPASTSIGKLPLVEPSAHNQSGDLSETWRVVDRLPPGGAIQALESTLRNRNHRVTSLQCGPDNFALITTLRSALEVARENQNIEVRDLAQGNQEQDLLFLSASQPATRDLLRQLKEERENTHWPFLLATVERSSSTSSLPAAGLNIRPTGGKITIEALEETVEFAVYLVSRQSGTESSGFEPVKRPVGEAPDNLRQRAQWFKRRSGV